jgi:thiol-disulfide isomerase/thioredoxin
MGEVSDLNGRTAQARRWRVVVSAAITALALAGCSRQPGGASGVDAAAAKELAHFAAGPMKDLVPSATRTTEFAIPFADADGRSVDLKKFRGKVVVVNFWATWCTPCITEMPTLAALQTRYAGKDLVVVPISERPNSMKDVKNFIDVHPPLPIYVDKDFTIPMKLELRALPVTIIYDRQGREVARVMGEADWDSPEATALIDHLLQQK